MTLTISPATRGPGQQVILLKLAEMKNTFSLLLAALIAFLSDWGLKKVMTDHKSSCGI
jgi:hypothetical protein